MNIQESDFMLIPDGMYTIGAARARLEPVYGAINDTPLKKEFLAASYPDHAVMLCSVFIKRKPTTAAEYSEFISETGYLTEAEKDGWGWVLEGGKWLKRDGVHWRRPFGCNSGDCWNWEDSLPVMQVSWNDAFAYCRWFAEKNTIRARLPREAEWEVFAQLTGLPGFGEVADHAVRESGFEEYLTVMQKSIHAGTYNSIGLIWEWTEDWYDRYPGGADNKDFGKVYKVLRGGSLMSHVLQHAREFRLRKCPTARSPYYGFRIAVEPRCK